jgi:peptidoglycan hydrolase-like protein with peptidoglycan-binding domain
MIAPAPPSTPLPAPPAGHIRLVMQDVSGHPRFTLTGQRVVVRGIVLPYVAQQKVLVVFSRDGRTVQRRTVSVQSLGNGAGQFHVGYTGAAAGLLSVRATHAASAGEGAFQGVSAPVRVISADIGPGAIGPSVRFLQSQLNALHYAVPLNGIFDEATGRAVIAYRKMTWLARTTATGSSFFHRLQHGAGGFNVRYPHDGRHVEADLTKQVLAEIEAGGRVRRIYTMSSGKPSTPTVIGHFTVYMKTPGTNAKGMVDANYFIRGYAIHGYAEVPTYAASHGCLRVPVPDAPAIYQWVQIGTPVDVYFEGGGGSHSVSGNAGP